MVLIDDPSDCCLCPVSFFLSHALADGVLEEVNEPADLMRM
jgi:hypothetical protein